MNKKLWIALCAAVAASSIAFFLKKKYYPKEIKTVTISWVKDTIKKRLAKKNIKKVAIAKIDDLLKNGSDNASFVTDDLLTLSKEGYSLLIASVSSDGKVNNVEVIKCEAIDDEVESLINRTHNGMVVVER